MAVSTFYSNAHPEATSVDGRVRHSAGALTWAQIIAGAGTGANDASPYESVCIAGVHFTQDTWLSLERGIFLFDTSLLGVGSTIISAVFSLYGQSKDDTLGAAPNVNVYSSAPASNIEVVAGDFDSLGSVPLCDTPIIYPFWSLTGYNDFILNAAGLAAISKTGITKLGTRNANYDAAGVPPTWVAGKAYHIYAYYADELSGVKRPKLVITYTPLATTPVITTNAATSIAARGATLNGTVTDDGGAGCSVAFDWGLTVDYTESSGYVATGKTTGQTFSHPITGLMPGMLYHFRAYGFNGTDWGYGNDMTFTTLGESYPSNAIIRVSALVHRWAAGPNPIYQLEIMLGGLTSTYISPIGSREVTPTLPLPEPGFNTYGLTLTDYGNWVAARTQQQIIDLFGHFPTFEEWVIWVIGGGI